jgi:hypothetical protein
MKTRILVGVSGWFAGVAVATCGTVVAVFLIGQGINTSPARTLSVNDVASALAEMARSPSAPDDAETAPQAVSPSASRGPSASPSRVAVGATTSAPRTLASIGGSVVAVCTSAGAYLSSWSPAQSYQVIYVKRGPSLPARVVFQSGTSRVALGVVCRGGTPVAFYGENESESPGDYGR